MKVKELREMLENTTKYDDMDFVVEVVGEKGMMYPGIPTVNVKQISIGFDWDSGKFILSTKEKLLWM